MLLKGKILPILSCFLFLFDKNMIIYWYSRKTIQWQKYIKLADIATLNFALYLTLTVERRMLLNKRPELQTDSDKLEEELMVAMVTDLQEKQTSENIAIERLIEIQVSLSC